MSNTSSSTLPPSQPETPTLIPQFCFNTRLVRDFLRTSRSHLDDTISTSLNSLLTPSTTTPFNPSSTSNPTLNRAPRPPIPTTTTTTFLNNILLPTWSARNKVITYCSHVAASPDPNDPDLPSLLAENSAQSQRKIDERLDPYSGRFFPREPRTEMLASVLRNENAVEGIVRERTWRVLEERCEGVEVGIGWEGMMDAWEEGRRKS